MTITLSSFDSAVDFSNHVENIIAETKNSLAVHMSRVEEIRKRYEKTKKRFDTIKKLTGGKSEMPKDTKQLDIAGFKVLMNPTAEYELTLMEEAISSLQEKLSAFEKTRDMVSVLSDGEIKCSMVLNEGIPTGFMFHVQE